MGNSFLDLFDGQEEQRAGAAVLDVFAGPEALQAQPPTPQAPIIQQEEPGFIEGAMGLIGFTPDKPTGTPEEIEIGKRQEIGSPPIYLDPELFITGMFASLRTSQLNTYSASSICFLAVMWSHSIYDNLRQSLL